MDFTALRRWRETYYQPLKEPNLDGDELKPFEDQWDPRRDERWHRYSMPLVAVFAGVAAIALVATLTSSSRSVTLKGSCPAQCPADPFIKPGVLHFGTYPNETRWLPFPGMSESDLGGPPWPSIDYDNNVIAEESLGEACSQYMKMMVEDNPEMSWVTNKTVIIIGTSHDRLNVGYFCEYAGGKYTPIAGNHGGGWCHVARYNFTLANWFIFGMVDGEYEWFHSPHDRPITFENRVHDKMLPMMVRAGVPGTPDLIIYGSVFWDERFLEEREREHGAQLHTSLTYTELTWYQARVRTFVAYLRSLYGSQVPIMFRARHFRVDNRGNGILRIGQLDQSTRAVAKDLGIKMFEWGSLLEGQTNMFSDGVHHFEKGRATFLFGDMMLFYLKQAITPKCRRCHRSRE